MKSESINYNDYKPYSKEYNHNITYNKPGQGTLKTSYILEASDDVFLAKNDVFR